jgi:hypothetical protein
MISSKERNILEHILQMAEIAQDTIEKVLRRFNSIEEFTNNYANWSSFGITESQAVKIIRCLKIYEKACYDANVYSVLMFNTNLVDEESFYEKYKAIIDLEIERALTNQINRIKEAAKRSFFRGPFWYRFIESIVPNPLTSNAINKLETERAQEYLYDQALDLYNVSRETPTERIKELRRDILYSLHWDRDDRIEDVDDPKTKKLIKLEKCYKIIETYRKSKNEW